MPDPIEPIVARHIVETASQGLPVAVDPDDADAMAAFEDEALTPEDALDSRFDDDVTEG